MHTVLKGLTMVWETAMLMGRGYSIPVVKRERTVGKEEARRSHSESGLKDDGGEVPNVFFQQHPLDQDNIGFINSLRLYLLSSILKSSGRMRLVF